MSNSEEWLKLAPTPTPLDPGRKWHAFLSYRSVERSWVLSLYDTLTQLGYATFLDQFVLDTASGLAQSLEDNLQASQGGVLVWSPRSEDSKWCRREYDTFIAKEDAGGFRFVIARVGNAELPLFAQARLWLDFSDEREGPRGTGLLKLLHGLQGNPLPPAAVKLAAEIDEESRRGLARIRARAADGDVDGIAQLARSDHIAWRSSPLLPCAGAQALVSIGHAKAALELLEPVIGDFPLSLRPRQLQGLALARAKRWREAKQVLGELYELGERDAETVGIYARTWMDSYEDTGNPLHLRRSRDLYAEAFKATSTDYYVGINAAAKSIFLNEIDVGGEYARRVEAIVGTAPAPGNYWMTATVAEVQLIRRNFGEAARLYGDAVAMSPGHVDDHASTRRQARRLLGHLSATGTEAALVLSPFSHVPDPVSAPVA